MTQRGNDRRPIFLDDNDGTRYLAILGRALERHGGRVHAYCLLTNHVHLLLQATERPLWLLMHVLGLRYARWFNDRWAHTGHLFQGRYYSGVVQGEAQVLITLRYIHLNPVRAGLVTDAADHRWSSHRAYAGDAPPHWLTTHVLLSLLGSTPHLAREAYGDLLGSKLQPEDVPPAMAGPSAPPSSERVSVERILNVVASETGCSTEAILGNSRDRRISIARFAVVHLARECAGARLVDLARLLNRDPATLYNGVARHTSSRPGAWEDLIEGVKLSLSSEKEIGNT